MISAVGLCFRNRNRLASLKSKDRLVLGPVVLVNAMDIFEQRDAPDEEEKERDTDSTVDEVKEHLIPQGWELML